MFLIIQACEISCMYVRSVTCSHLEWREQINRYTDKEECICGQIHKENIGSMKFDHNVLI